MDMLVQKQSIGFLFLKGYPYYVPLRSPITCDRVSTREKTCTFKPGSLLHLSIRYFPNSSLYPDVPCSRLRFGLQCITSCCTGTSRHHRSLNSPPPYQPRKVPSVALPDWELTASTSGSAVIHVARLSPFSARVVRCCRRGRGMRCGEMGRGGRMRYIAGAAERDNGREDVPRGCRAQGRYLFPEFP